MTSGPFPGAFPHQHGDPQTLKERIDAQIRARIEEAVEMAGLEVMVEVRKRENRPAPEESSAADRDEFQTILGSFLAHLTEAFHATLSTDEHRGFEAAQGGEREPRARLYAGQVFLAKRLPDYWQRFDTHRAAFARARVATPSESPGWLRRLFGV